MVRLNYKKCDKIQYLKWYDIIIVTIIMFGYLIWNSIISFASSSYVNSTHTLEFTSIDN